MNTTQDNTNPPENPSARVDEAADDTVAKQQRIQAGQDRKDEAEQN